MLLARLREAQREELAARLQAALDGLAPALLELPAYEREVLIEPAGRGRRQRETR